MKIDKNNENDRNNFVLLYYKKQKSSDASITPYNEVPELKKNKNDGKESWLKNALQFHKDGTPFVDINKFIPKPTKRIKRKSRLLLAWYLSDYVSITANFLHLMIGSYFWMIGMGAISWHTTVDSFMNGFSLLKQNNQNGKFDSTIKGIDIMPIGVFYIIQSILILSNTIIGVCAFFLAIRIMFIAHIAMDIIFMVTQFTVAVIVIQAAKCDFEVHFSNTFKTYMQNYGKVRQGEEFFDTAIVVDNLQLSFECCGIHGWTDYLNNSIVNNQKYTFDGTLLIVPNSCCSIWWTRDLTCSRYSHIYGNPGGSLHDVVTFKNRINGKGCADAIEEKCLTLVYHLGAQTLPLVFLSAFLIVVKTWCVLVQLRNVHKITIQGHREQAEAMESLMQTQYHADETTHTRFKKAHLSKVLQDTSENDVDENYTINEKSQPTGDNAVKVNDWLDEEQNYRHGKSEEKLLFTLVSTTNVEDEGVELQRSQREKRNPEQMIALRTGSQELTTNMTGSKQSNHEITTQCEKKPQDTSKSSNHDENCVDHSYPIGQRNSLKRRSHSSKKYTKRRSFASSSSKSSNSKRQSSKTLDKFRKSWIPYW